MTLRNLYVAMMAANLLACGGSDVVSQPHGAQDEQSTVTDNKQSLLAISASTERAFLKQDITFDVTSKSALQGKPDFIWQITDSQNQAVISLESDEPSIQYRATTAGQFNVHVKVVDENGQSRTANNTFTVLPEPVIAIDLGPDFEAKQGQSVSLTARESMSQVGAIEKLSWSLLTSPEGYSSSEGNEIASLEPTFLFDVVGQYQIQLSATDEYNNTVSDEVTVTITETTKNSPPRAMIHGLRQQVKPNEVLVLDGSDSYDPDAADLLLYSWQVTAKPNASLVHLSSPFDEEVAIRASKKGDYTVELVVKDLAGLESKAQYDFSINDSDQPPVALLRADLTAAVGDALELLCDACIDPEQQPLTGEWKLTIKPDTSNAQITDSQVLTGATLIADTSGIYGVKLLLSDGVTSTWSNTQLINVSATEQSKPTAVIAPISDITLGQSVTLDASQSRDPEGVPLSYAWQIVSQPGSDVLPAPSSAKFEFTPSQLGSYKIALVTSDGSLHSEQAHVQFSVSNNQAPVIQLAEPIESDIAVGDMVTIDASMSNDPEGDALSFQWRLITPNNEVKTDTQNNSQFSFSADTAGDYQVELTLSDEHGASATQTFEFSALDLPQAITGEVKGRIVDSQLRGVAGARLVINGEQLSTNSSGYFSQSLQLASGEKATIKTVGEKLIAAQYQSQALTEDGFIVELGEAFVPAMQSVSQHVWSCFGYQGEDSINIRYELVNTFPSNSPFTFEYDQTLTVPLNQKQDIELPATATYRITPEEDDKYYISSSSNRITIKWLEGYQQPVIYNVCNYK